MDHFDVIIVGAGHAGAQAAIALRQLDFEGSIGLLTEEPDWPYERPPLSKDYLAGDKPFGAILLRPPDFWAERGITLWRGMHVQAVNPAVRTVGTSGGLTLGYGKLIWAAGGHARRLTCNGHHLAGVHTVRSRADVDRLRAELGSAAAIAIIGGGYIGLETAAVLRKQGKSVTVIEMQDRVLARVAGAPLSRFYEAEHRAQGVEILLRTAVDCIEERDGRACGVRLADGTILPADMVVAGIGIVPAVKPLLDAGATGGNGVNVDAFCRTSLPNVFAIGDCAAHVNRFAGGERVRLESVQNAADQAGVVAKAIAARPIPYDSVPWFWSNQYDLRLQTIGLSLGHDDTVVRGDPSARSFSVIYLRENRVIALDCVNATRDYVQGKPLVAAGLAVDRALLADAALPLKTHK
jgi:3-phenylpropionate/trans-cinnamate dioxygenase ferredoxin reductase subunit